MVTVLKPSANPESPQDLKPRSALKAIPARIASKDIFHAITMLSMIFVNDLWSLKDISICLEHVLGDADGMGFV